MREELIRETSSLLAKEGYEIFCCAGMRACFDIVARRGKELLLAKAFEDIDALTQQQAGDLQKISLLLGAKFLLLGARAGGERLQQGVLYERHGIPAVGVGTLKEILEGVFPSERKFKALSVSIDGGRLAAARMDAGITLDALAEKAGISRETLWRYEHGRMGASEENAECLERILGVELRMPLNPFEFRGVSIRERTILSPVGFESVRAKSAPFELAAKERSKVIAGEEADKRTMGKRAVAYGKISEMLDSSACFLLKESAKDSIEGVPVVRKREIKEMRKPRDLLKLIEERSD
jgi:putative transcriptional regulator